MNGRRFSYPPVFFALAAVIILRRATSGEAAFASEFIIEDLVLLLILIFAASPQRLKPFFGCVISAFASTAVAVLIWSVGTPRFPVWQVVADVAVPVLLAVHSASRAVIEFLRLRNLPTAIRKPL